MAGTNDDPIAYSPQMKHLIRTLEQQDIGAYRHIYGSLGLVIETAVRLQARGTLLGIAEEHCQFKDYHRHSKRMAKLQSYFETAKSAYEFKVQNGIGKANGA